MASYDNIVTEGLVFSIAAANKQTNQATGIGKDISSMVNASEEGEFSADAIILNNEFVFDGADDRIFFGDINSFERTDTFTINAWIKMSNTAFGSIINKTNGSRGLALYKSGDGLLFTLANQEAGGNQLRFDYSGLFLTDVYYSVIVTYDGLSNNDSVKTYIDGESVTESSVLNTLTMTTITTTPFNIGARNDALHVFDGSIPMVSIYDRVLSAEEVSKNYESQKHRFH